ncbi:hypothetical protein [Maribellus sediminis]|uniref:hypothetical protein n=1 Tax=Maribellus sediminis TaxID=2696285 RepID=UPI00142F7696|nr:hypothetical protein [Maribellus sediminis]
MKKKAFTREQLYELVWSESMTALSKRFNISDVGLRKTCKRMNIPTPKLGYWAKLKHGYKVEKEKLSIDYKGVTTVMLEQLDAGLSEKQHRISKLNQLQKQIEKENEKLLIVPQRLSAQEKEITDIQNSIKSKNYRSINGLLDVQWNGVFDFKTSSANVPRALRILNTLIKVLKVRGHDIKKSNRHTKVLVFGSEINISMREKLSKVESKDFWTNPYEPTGTLAIFVDRWTNTEYKDGKQPLEEQLSRVIAMIEIKGEEEKIEREKRKEEKRQLEIRRQNHEKREDQKDLELKLFRDLILNSQRWHKSENLRRYIDKFEATAKVKNKELSNWLAWARAKADWYDPFIESEDD